MVAPGSRRRSAARTWGTLKFDGWKEAQRAQENQRPLDPKT